MNLFEKYELHKKKFSPGVIWEANGEYTVKRIQIISNDDEVYRYKGFDEPDEEKKTPAVSFVILDTASNRQTRHLFKGNRVSWSRAYMERLYTPIS